MQWIGALAGRTHPAWRRVKFDELLAQQLSMRFAYRRRRARQAPVLKVNGPLLKAFLERLPFRLTKAQTRAMNEVLRDLREPHPMQRLLQGDVGSGKTIVAVFAALLAIENGFQACLMAPTELLAEQHARSISRFLAPLGISPIVITGSLGARERREIDTRLASFEPVFVIGTHALVQERTRFAKLGLVPRLLHTVAGPSVAYLLLVAGLLLVVFEFFTVGIGLADDAATFDAPAREVN